MNCYCISQENLSINQEIANKKQDSEQHKDVIPSLEKGLCGTCHLSLVVTLSLEWDVRLAGRGLLSGWGPVAGAWLGGTEILCSDVDGLVSHPPRPPPPAGRALVPHSFSHLQQPQHVLGSQWLCACGGEPGAGAMTSQK